MGFAFLSLLSVLFDDFFLFYKRHTSKQTICLEKGAGKGGMGRERKIREEKKWEKQDADENASRGPASLLTKSSSARTAPTGAGLSGPSESTPVLRRASTSWSPSQAKREGSAGQAQTPGP